MPYDVEIVEIEDRPTLTVRTKSTTDRFPI